MAVMAFASSLAGSSAKVSRRWDSHAPFCRKALFRTFQPREMSDRLEQDGVSGCGFTQVLQLDLEDDAFLTSTFKRDTGSLSQTLTFAGIG